MLFVWQSKLYLIIYLLHGDYDFVFILLVMTLILCWHMLRGTCFFTNKSIVRFFFIYLCISTIIIVACSDAQTHLVKQSSKHKNILSNIYLRNFTPVRITHANQELLFTTSYNSQRRCFSKGI